MDVKTLSAIIGHISSATTIDIYSHITGAMQQQAAQKIERGIGHSEAYEPHEALDDQLPAKGGKPPVSPPFAPYKGKVRKPSTGGIYELNGHLYEGRYSPTNAQGKREMHTVYAKTREECEALLQKMIAEVRERIKEEKGRVKEDETEAYEINKKRFPPFCGGKLFLYKAWYHIICVAIDKEDQGIL